VPRGGRRTGTPGTAYSNRTDLQQPVRTAPSQAYGEAKQSADAQRALPLPQTAPVVSMGAPPPEPGSLGAFDRPSDRPGEPITSGLPMGAGPGPNAMSPAVDPTLDTLRAAYLAFPSPALGEAIEARQRAIGQ
jgi:hypothetical protein